MKNKSQRKKLILSAFIALTLLAIALTTLSACDVGQVNQRELAAECIRIHIRANSNGTGDQAVKYAVRDRITAYLEDALSACTTKREAQAVLQRESQNLVRIADGTLSAHGFAYKSSVRMGNEYFPDRDYDGYTFPAGNYDALVINLGSGSGDNWWCVAFPPLCFVPDGDNGEKVVYKSWIKEILDKLFNK